MFWVFLGLFVLVTKYHVKNGHQGVVKTSKCVGLAFGGFIYGVGLAFVGLLHCYKSLGILTNANIIYIYPCNSYPGPETINISEPKDKSFKSPETALQEPSQEKT